MGGRKAAQMELTQLRYFKTLAESESLSKAADKLFISPPALSSSISRLENELGATLFDRKKTMILNARGMVFLEHITQALNALDNAQKAVKEEVGRQQSHLSIGVASAIVWHNLFLDFLAQYPHIGLEQHLVSLEKMSDDHILEQYDFIIAAPEDLSTEKLHSVCLYSDDYPVLMVPATHPLANRKEISLSEVKNEGFVALPKGNSSRAYFDRLWDIAGFKPKIIVECDMQIRRTFVLAGRGLAIATAHTKYTNTEPGLHFVDIVNPYYRRSQCLYWHEHRFQTMAAQAFRSFAQDYFKNGYKGKGGKELDADAMTGSKPGA